MLDKGAWRCI